MTIVGFISWREESSEQNATRLGLKAILGERFQQNVEEFLIVIQNTLVGIYSDIYSQSIQGFVCWAGKMYR